MYEGPDFKNDDYDIDLKDYEIMMEVVPREDFPSSSAGAFQTQPLFAPIKDPEEVQSIEGRE